MKIRGIFIVDGNIIGIGYRDEVQRIARELGLTGTVRFLKDCTVKIIAEGAAKGWDIPLFRKP